MTTKQHDYRPGTKLAKFAILLLSGRTIEQIAAMPGAGKFDGISAAKVRRELIAAKKLDAAASPLRHKGREAATPVVQFHPETIAFKVKALLDAGKTDEQIIAAGYSKQTLYSVRHQIKKKIAAGKPGKALVALPPALEKMVDKAVDSVRRDAVARKARKSNGHDVPAANGSAFPVPVVEVIFHRPDGSEVPLFATADIFPHVYAVAARKLGFI